MNEGVVPSILRASRNRRDTRQLDEEEEMWFDEEEAFEGGTTEEDSVVPTPPPALSSVQESDLDSIGMQHFNFSTFTIQTEFESTFSSSGKLMEKKNDIGLVNAVNGPHKTVTPSSPPPLQPAQSSEEIQLPEPKLFNKVNFGFFFFLSSIVVIYLFGIRTDRVSSTTRGTPTKRRTRRWRTTTKRPRARPQRQIRRTGHLSHRRPIV